MPVNPVTQDKRGILLPNSTRWTYDSAYPNGDRSVVGQITALGGVDFDGLTSGQSVTSLVSAYGTYGNGYGMQGDTAIKRAGKTSSAEMSIQSGTTGRSGDGTPIGNGDFGFIYSLADQGHTVSEGQELWIYGWIYVPVGFNFNTASNGLKFIRFSYPTLGPELDTYMADGQEFSTGDNTENAGWHLVNESYPQLSSNMHKRTQAVFVKGQWNFFCKYTKASTSQNQSVERLWINDELAMEHVGGVSDVTTKWVDENGTLQTAIWTPSAGSGNNWSTLNPTSPTISSFYLCTYWNNNSPQDQQLNVQSMQYVKSDAGLSTDAYGNRYIDSSQVA